MTKAEPLFTRYVVSQNLDRDGTIIEVEIKDEDSGSWAKVSKRDVIAELAKPNVHYFVGSFPIRVVSGKYLRADRLGIEQDYLGDLPPCNP